MNKDNILKLAEMLESPAAEEHFDMDYLFRSGESAKGLPVKDAINHCGSVACIAGWAAVLANPEMSSYTAGSDADAIAAEWLGIGLHVSEYSDDDRAWHLRGDNRAWHLFYTNTSSDTTPKQAAKVLRHLAETGEVDWSIIDEV